VVGRALRKEYHSKYGIKFEGVNFIRSLGVPNYFLHMKQEIN
jgi:hypothetical protein